MSWKVLIFSRSLPGNIWICVSGELSEFISSGFVQIENLLNGMEKKTCFPVQYMEVNWEKISKSIKQGSSKSCEVAKDI